MYVYISYKWQMNCFVTMNKNTVHNECLFLQTTLEHVVMANSEQPSLEAQLQAGMEKILAAVSPFADSDRTRDYRQHTIISLCGDLKEKTAQLLSALESSEAVEEAEEEEGEDGEGVSRRANASFVVAECVAELRAREAELHQEVSLRIYPQLSLSLCD